VSDLYFTPAYELAARLRAGDLSPVELMEACLARIDEVNPILNAFIAMKPDEALDEARKTGDRIARGESVGTLAGLPFGVKELEDVAGYPSTHASVPFKDNYPKNDSVQVERLKRAGAIVLGKTNSPEFGSTAFTRNLLFGVTRNPWNVERTPGGSSGGSAAAVASGMVPFATGSDGGGSIRIPACYSGCFGIKVTFGRVPRGPFDMLDWSQTVCFGPLTRTVHDAALYLDAVVGPHPADPNSLPHPGLSYVEVLERLPKGLRIGWSPTLGYAKVQPDILREAAAAARVFEGLGHSIEEIDEVFPEAGVAWATIAGPEVYAEIEDHIEGHRSEFGQSFLAGTELMGTVTASRYGQAQRTRAELVNILCRLFDRYDLLLTPTLPTEAFGATGKMPAEIGGVPVTNPIDLVAFTYPFNLTGHPAATVRAGFTDNGLPCGLQIVAPYHREDLILQAAYTYEQARPWNDRWPREITPLNKPAN
jgi:Asp-tRNA(Asn)/Glu-tRNA(Gln) amidotransferase A subunit family amidase